ncbi:hypothetical protein HYALB_00001018 [Hymenoscyphus albidus]|uniref:Uncharacterized protein n=1 Tax=Hymenoscyphus albidus TaxID=595503 RepID=A0A9N9LZT3_9HELO|nr:hypothetical protein HYALB_00001018 [Hymenoscyphus albidus]
MASPATRRALGDIHPNTPISNPTTLLEKGKNTFEKMERVVAAAATPGAAVREGSVESLVGSEKRGFGRVGGEESCSKRVKRFDVRDLQERGSPRVGGYAGRKAEKDVTNTDEELLSPSPSVSPSSSFGSSHAALNDSQQTVLTEPDQLPTAPNSFEVPNVPRASSPLTKEQAREKSKKLRLRLQLAAYKVQTNQIEVPIDRLELRTSSSTMSSPIPPRHTMQVPSATIPRPWTATSRVPTIQLQGPSSAEKSSEKGKGREMTSFLGSSPPPPPRYRANLGGVMRSPEKRDMAGYVGLARGALGCVPDLGMGEGDGDAARDLLLLRESASKK